MSKAKLLLAIIVPFALYADTCFVASGQTVAFNLSVGSKASWNNTISGVKPLPSLPKNGISFSIYQLSNGNIAFKIPGFQNDAKLQISLFSVNGRKIGATVMNGLKNGEYGKRLMPGIYFARLEANGTILGTTRFMVGR